MSDCPLPKDAEEGNILLADDHPAILLGTQMALISGCKSRTGRISQASDADEVLRHLRSQPCDMLITDYCMPGGNFPDGIPMISHVRRNFPQVNVIVMTMLNTPDVLQLLLRLGVRGLIDKHSPLCEVNTAVNYVVRGRRYVSPSFTQALDAHTPTLLSARELEVVRLFGQKLSGREIAERLSRSEKTISRQKRMAMEKLGLNHGSELVDYVRKAGFR